MTIRSAWIVLSSLWKVSWQAPSRIRGFGQCSKVCISVSLRARIIMHCTTSCNTPVSAYIMRLNWSSRALWDSPSESRDIVSLTWLSMIDDNIYVGPLGTADTNKLWWNWRWGWGCMVACMLGPHYNIDFTHFAKLAHSENIFRRWEDIKEFLRRLFEVVVSYLTQLQYLKWVQLPLTSSLLSWGLLCSSWPISVTEWRRSYTCLWTMGPFIIRRLKFHGAWRIPDHLRHSILYIVSVWCSFSGKAD